MPLSEDSFVVAVDGLTSADLGGEAVVLDAHSGRYFGLNELGVRIFDLLQTETSVQTIIDTLLGEYDVERERLREDVLAFIQNMQDQRLVKVANEAS